MSSAASDPRSVAAFLSACAAAFAELGVRWYLFGAQAAFLYGAARMTIDVDLTVMLDARSPQELSAALSRHRVRVRVGEDEAAFIEQTRVLPVVHMESGVAGDIVLAGPGLEEGFLERAVERDVLGVKVPVAAAEDLVVMKVLAGRPKDIADVKAIVAAQGDALKVDDIRETLRLVEAALGQSDLLPAFEKVLVAARAPKRRPKRRG
jgi:hypothetical protein